MLQLQFKNIKVNITFGFFAVMTIFFLFDKYGYGIFSLLCILIHEVSHLIAFHLLKYPINNITFYYGGIKIFKPLTHMKFIDELIVQSMGIFINLSIFFILLPHILKNPIISYSNVFGVMNLLVGLLNLLPFYVFDGGKILNIILSHIFSEHTAYKIHRYIIILFIIIILTVISLQYDNIVGIILESINL